MNLLPKSIAIIGPTASGKSELAMLLAKKHSGSIINCDSVQMYKGFDLGSAKASKIEQKEIPHYLLDVVKWDNDFDAAYFCKLANTAIKESIEKARLPIIVGGTALYFRALCGDNFHTLPTDKKLRSQLSSLPAKDLYEKLTKLDPRRAKELHPNDSFRIARSLEIAITSGKTLSELTQIPSYHTKPKITILCAPSKEKLKDRIIKRTKKMFANDDFICEVRELLNSGCDINCKAMQTIGYKQVAKYLCEKNISRSELENLVHIATRQYARKQMMWFRNIEVDLTWDHSKSKESIIETVDEFL